ncbi:DUF6252 family protein [Pedobacter arcticus]|uniref:DUF6252 family protein n=1 Tax=Pedobacter arcticus TaxID=752140 RepID=UPI000306D794|nr:DUF6252 family protein [Pedobacter arcticus]
MKTFKKIILASIILLLTTSCKKDDLPKATQEGKNIMAAMVNGKVWVKTACWSCIGGGGGINALYENGLFRVSGQQFNNKSDNTVIVILIKNLKLGENSINGITISPEFNDYGNNNYFKTNSSSTGMVNITKIDTVRKIISGTFSFKAENEDDPNDIITVTDGRFDITYK